MTKELYRMTEHTKCSSLDNRRAYIGDDISSLNITLWQEIARCTITKDLPIQFMLSPLLPSDDSRPLRPDGADTEREWEDLRIWVQRYAKYIRISQVALDAGMSVEMAQALLLRDKNKTRIPRTNQRLDALLAVFTRPPFRYITSNNG